MRAAGAAVVVAVTRGGAVQAARLVRHDPAAELIVGQRAHAWVADLPNPVTVAPRGGLGPLLGERMQASAGQVVAFLSVGATVRLVAPYLRGKGLDPGVVAVDESARFAVAVVGGHLGGANAWAEHVAACLGAQPVVTTASDRRDLPAIDLLGREQGWQVEASPEALREAAGALINGEPVALVEEADVWCPNRPPPPNLERLVTLAQADPARHSALLWVTERAGDREQEAVWAQRLVRYRPRQAGP